jgi:hypothetical protein
MEIIKDKNLMITLHKVKAHSNDLHNDMADELVTQGLNTEPINLHVNAHARNSVLLPIWNSMGIIDTNPRKWIKKVLQARIFNNFIFNSDFTTIRSIFSNTDINWEYTSLWTKRNPQAEEVTSFKFTRHCSYKIKSISHQLPTSDLQSRNYPLLYHNLTPVLCQSCRLEIDDNSHIGRCINTKKEINQAFKEAKILLISLLKELEEVNDFLVETSIDSLKCLEEIDNNSRPIPNSHHIYLWAHNIIPNELIQFLHSHMKHTKQLKSVLWTFLDTFMKNIRKITWINRCDLMKQ